MRRSFIRTLVPLAAITLVAGGCSDETTTTAAAPTLPPRTSGRVAPADSVAGGTAADTTTAGPRHDARDTAEAVQTGESLSTP